MNPVWRKCFRRLCSKLITVVVRWFVKLSRLISEWWINEIAGFQLIFTHTFGSRKKTHVRFYWKNWNLRFYKIITYVRMNETGAKFGMNNRIKLGPDLGFLSPKHLILSETGSMLKNRWLCWLKKKIENKNGHGYVFFVRSYQAETENSDSFTEHVVH